MKTVLLLTYASVACAPLRGAVRYVDVNSANPRPPYRDWSTAAANIQDAIDESSPEDQIVVTNGVCQTGSRQTPGGSGTNRLVVVQAVTVRSVNGFGVTVIRGEPGDSTREWSGMRCAYLAEGAVLVGFTLTNGGSLEGGGVYGGTLSNCVLSGNTAVHGGGAAFCRLVDCLIEDNSAEDGAGAWNCETTRCAVVGNQASVGGGLWGPPPAGDDGHGPWGWPSPTTCLPWGCEIAALGSLPFSADRVRQLNAMMQAWASALPGRSTNQMAWGYRAFGHMQLRLERFEQALAALETSASYQAPPDASTRFLQAACLHRLGRAGEARAAFEQAEALLDPDLRKLPPTFEGFRPAWQINQQLLVYRETQTLLGVAATPP
jgi:hypothetical protein